MKESRLTINPLTVNQMQATRAGNGGGGVGTGGNDPQTLPPPASAVPVNTSLVFGPQG